MPHPHRSTVRLAPALALTLLTAALLGTPLVRGMAPQTAAPASVLAPVLIAGDNDKGGMGGG